MRIVFAKWDGVGMGTTCLEPAPLSFLNETRFNFNKWVWDGFEIFFKPGVGLGTASSHLALPRLYIKLI